MASGRNTFMSTTRRVGRVVHPESGRLFTAIFSHCRKHPPSSSPDFPSNWGEQENLPAKPTSNQVLQVNVARGEKCVLSADTLSNVRIVENDSCGSDTVL